MNINCYYDLSNSDWNVSRYFESIFNALKQHYTEFTIEKVSTDSLRVNNTGPCVKFGHHHMIIENVESKKYFLITYWDKMSGISEYAGWDMENCVEIFTSSGVHDNDVYYNPLNINNYTPFSYLTSRLDVDETCDKLSMVANQLRVIPNKPMFKGNLYLFREYLKQDDRFNVLSTGDGKYLPFPDYIRHLNKYAINMSLNGAGEICYRDMEIMRLGTALFRPKLVTRFNEPLIPNYHYISVDYDSIKDELNHETLFKLQSDLMIQRWDEVIKDRDYIDEVSKNGKAWFERNGTKEKHAEIALKLVNFDKLK
tara:strand:- start:109 stop:1041 length:933 start_codon:yes stop_codon:yes gene_type:complete